MRLLYYLYIYLKKLYHRYAPLAIKWYWAQNDKVRHRVGWAIVLTGVCLCGVILWGIILGVRQVGFLINGRETVTDSLAVVNSSDANDPVCLDWYSGDYKHRKFKCKELNPKRNVILYRDFKDLNDVQLIAARRLGVRPLAKRDQIEKEGRKLVKLKDTRFYHVDPMTHSVPCLVPDAADFLNTFLRRNITHAGGRFRLPVHNEKPSAGLRSPFQDLFPELHARKLLFHGTPEDLPRKDHTDPVR